MPLLFSKMAGAEARQPLGEGGHLLASVAGPGPASEPPSGKTDLLLRFFASQFFDEWIALT